MGVATSLGIVVAVLIRVLQGFPGAEMDLSRAGAEGPIDETFSVDAVNQAAGLLSNRYMQLIDELIYFQKDPDYRRAEDRLGDMVRLGDSVTGQFQVLDDRLQGALVGLADDAHGREPGSPR